MSEDGFDFAKRELCPDEACIGLIGPDGRCKECGKVSASAVADPRHQGMADPHPDDEASDFGAEEGRELCPDEACVGLIGPDGTCKVCGTPRTPGAPAAGAGSGGGAAAEDRAGGHDGDNDDDVSGDGTDASFDSARELCPDGACIGLIGPDGRCKVCGKAAKGDGAGSGPEPGPEPDGDGDDDSDSDPEPESDSKPAAEPDANPASS